MTYVANATTFRKGGPNPRKPKALDPAHVAYIERMYAARKLGRWPIPAKCMAARLGISQRQFGRIARLVALRQPTPPAKHSRCQLATGAPRTHGEAITAAQWRTPPQVGA